MYLFLAFLMVPLIEIGLFIQVGGWIGLWPTLAIVMATAVLGSWLVRSQGLQAMARLQRSFSELGDPTRPLADGAMILFSGALLLTPGFFTDALGFALLLPPVRAAVYGFLARRVTVARFEMGAGPGGHNSDPGRTARDVVIEADYEDVTGGGNAPQHQSGGTKGSSGWTRPPDGPGQRH